MHRPILCLDFDGVIHSYKSGWMGARTIPDPPVPGAFSFMLGALSNGFDVVICSSRCRYFLGKRAIRQWIYRHAGPSLYYESPAGPGLEEVRVVSRKPPALVTVDDRALTFTGKWPSLQEIREFRPWNRQGGGG